MVTSVRDATTSESKGAKNAHSRVRVPQLVPETDEISLWFARFENICKIAELEEEYWATKVSEYFDADMVHTAFSLDEKSRADYQTVNDAVLGRYIPDGNRQRFVNYNPSGKKKFMEYVANLQRLFTT